VFPLFLVAPFTKCIFLFLLPGLQVIIINAVDLVKEKGHYDFISPGIAVITGVCVGVGI